MNMNIEIHDANGATINRFSTTDKAEEFLQEVYCVAQRGDIGATVLLGNEYVPETGDFYEGEYKHAGSMWLLELGYFHDGYEACKWMDGLSIVEVNDESAATS